MTDILYSQYWKFLSAYEVDDSKIQEIFDCVTGLSTLPEQRFIKLLIQWLSLAHTIGSDDSFTMDIINNLIMIPSFDEKTITDFIFGRLEPLIEKECENSNFKLFGIEHKELTPQPYCLLKGMLCDLFKSELPKLILDIKYLRKLIDKMKYDDLLTHQTKEYYATLIAPLYYFTLTFHSLNIFIGPKPPVSFSFIDKFQPNKEETNISLENAAKYICEILEINTSNALESIYTYSKTNTFCENKFPPDSVNRWIQIIKCIILIGKFKEIPERTKIIVCGTQKCGKTTLIQGLLGLDISEGFNTRFPTIYSIPDSKIDLVDTPGVDDAQNLGRIMVEYHLETAKSVMIVSDCGLFNSITTINLLTRVMEKAGCPVYIFLNGVDKYLFNNPLNSHKSYLGLRRPKRNYSPLRYRNPKESISLLLERFNKENISHLKSKLPHVDIKRITLKVTCFSQILRHYLDIDKLFKQFEITDEEREKILWTIEEVLEEIKKFILIEG